MFLFPYTFYLCVLKFKILYSNDPFDDNLSTLRLESVWLGYYSSNGISEPWFWLDWVGSPGYNFTMWKENHPSINGEACASIINTRISPEWEDTSCSMSKHYVCESKYIFCIFKSFARHENFHLK